MKIKIFIFLFALIAQGCQKKNEEQNTLAIKNIKEIEKLNSEEKQKNFLIAIIDEDQAIRNQYESVITQFGYNSLQQKEHTEVMKKIDKTNLLKIEYYLKLYGHPTLKQHGEKAVYCVWLVIHHSSKVEVREKYFDILRKAYIAGDLDESLFLLYLQRFYSLKYEKDFVTNDSKNEIDNIIKALDL